MTLGNKIRKYRKLNGLTQKEVGLKVGFSEQTADSRIRKYESDMMAPKAVLRNKLADALGVDLLHMAEPSGRFCGREWPRSGASGRVP